MPQTTRSRRRRRYKYRPYNETRKYHPIRWLLARYWNAVWWIWSTVIVGGLLVSILVSYLINGTPGVARPDSWFLVHVLLAHIVVSAVALAIGVLLTLAGYIAHRQERAALLGISTMEYVRKRVDHLDPRDCGLEKYVDSVYLRRRDAETGGDADAAAREALRQATISTAVIPDTEAEADAEKSIGICIFGRPLAGKRRLAWEAMQEVVPRWTLVKWPYKPMRPFDLAALRGRSVVLWLDNLSKYVGFGQAPTISDLPHQFAEAGIPLVIVATCRYGQDKIEAERHFGSMLTHLTPISPTDISDEEANELLLAFDKVGFPADLEEFDGAPGSLLLGVAHMRDQIYPRLRDSAKRLLHTLKLLHSAGITTYPAPRTRAVAKEVFRLPRWRWEAARDALILAGFIRLGPLEADGEHGLEPIAEVYLDRAVKNYPALRTAITDDWPKLQDSLTAQRDAQALISLGNAFTGLHVGAATKHADDLRPNYQRAEACFRAALEVYDRESFPKEWASAQYGLGRAYRNHAELMLGVERTRLLTASQHAFAATLEVFTRESFPLACAQTQGLLGVTLKEQAKQAAGGERIRLLHEAEATLRTPLDWITKESAPNVWQVLQSDLAVVLGELADIATAEERRKLLTEAVEALRASLSVISKARNPGDWAIRWNNVGVALQKLSRQTEGGEQIQLLQEAEAAFRAALDVHREQLDPDNLAGFQSNLGSNLLSQAGRASGIERVRLIGDAEEAFLAVLDLYTREREPIGWANAQSNLGGLYRMRADDTPQLEQRNFLYMAEEAYRAALEVRKRDTEPWWWASIQEQLARVHLQLAFAEMAVNCAELRQARQYVGEALSVFDADAAPVDHERASGLYSQIEQAMLQHDCAEYKLDVRRS